MRFSLFSLFLSVTIVGLVLGWASDRSALQRELAREDASQKFVRCFLASERYSEVRMSNEEELLERELGFGDNRSVWFFEPLRFWEHARISNPDLLPYPVVTLVYLLGCKTPNEFREGMIESCSCPKIAIDPSNKHYDSFQKFLTESLRDNE